MNSRANAAPYLFGAVEFAARGVAASPLDEDLRISLIRMLASSGRSADALKQYADFESFLLSECNEAPSHCLRDLATKIRSLAPAQASRPLRALPTPDSHPEPKTLSAHSGNDGNDLLPSPLTRFFGREHELSLIEELLPQQLKNNGTSSPASKRTESIATENTCARLITLTGPGGVGKTRLAIEAARRCRNTSRAPVFFVPLADTDDPLQIHGAIADAMQLPRAAQADPLDQIVHSFSGDAALIVLDNAEHLLAENLRLHGPTPGNTMDLRSVVALLLQRASTLVLLLTSRQALALGGETQVTISPLPLPEQDATEPCGGSAAVQLFMDRALLVRPELRVTEKCRRTIADICIRLDGMPLSIELAAAWSQMLTPMQMLARLDKRLPLLVSRNKCGPARHYSLNATMDYSFRLLPPELQRVFARLSVFRGGWTLEMAEQVCGAALESLAELKGRSLVQSGEVAEAMRYSMLEALRTFAETHLQHAEREHLSRLHAIRILQLAEAASAGLLGPDQIKWMYRLIAEQENLRAALAWSIRTSRECEAGSIQRQIPGASSIVPGSGDIALRLAAALGDFWTARGQVIEGRRWLAAALEQTAESGCPSTRAKAYYSDAKLACVQADDTGAMMSAEAAINLDTTPGEVTADAQLLKSRVMYRRGELDQAEDHLAQCLALCRQINYHRGLASALVEQGRRRGFSGDYTEADDLLSQSKLMYERLQDQRGIVSACYEQAIIYGYRQEFETASELYEQAQAMYIEVGDRVGMSWAAFGIGYIARLRRQYDVAASALEEHLSIQRQLQSTSGCAIALRNLGCVARDRGEYARATALFEEALKLYEKSGEQQGVAETLGSLGVVALYRGDYAEARRLHNTCLACRRERGCKQDMVESLIFLSRISVAEGDLPTAAAFADESLALARDVGSRITIANGLLAKAEVCICRNNHTVAEQLLGEYPRMLGSAGDEWELIAGIEVVALLCASREAWEPAAQLLGSVEKLAFEIQYRRFPYRQLLLDRAATAARAHIDPEMFARAWNEGRAMTGHEAREYAVSNLCCPQEIMRLRSSRN